MRPSPAPPRPLAPGLLLACATALLVARPLVPSEMAASQGGGQIFVVLWLTLATAWAALVALGRVPSLVRLRVGDYLVLVLFGVHAAAGLYGAAGGATRPALNLLGEQVALAMGYLLVRQFVTSPQAARALMAAMIALAASEAALGLYQAAVTLPATRAAYHANPELALAEAGIYAPAGSAQRALFEQRLASTEPLARFELTNSLAGLLLAWLVVLVAGTLDGKAHGPPWRRCGPWIVALVILVCLVLTKSRSAYLALAVAVMVIGGQSLWRRGWMSISRLAVVTALFVGLIAAAAAFGGLDREVLTEAPKSLGYRLQYWQATWAMIRTSPWVGVGYGNFADAYTRFKLPTASEEIADPHNLLLETVANSGVMAGLLLFAALATFFFQHGRSTAMTDPAPVADAFSTRCIAGGALAAPLLAWIAGLLADVPLVPIELLLIYSVGGAAWWLLEAWRYPNVTNSSVVGPAVAALLVNLLAAGGIGFPSVAGSLWTLIALGSAAPWNLPPKKVGTPNGALLGAACLALATALVYIASFLPVVRSQYLLREVQSIPSPPDEQRARLNEAAAADPLAPEPWSSLATLELEVARGDGGPPGNLQAFRAAMTTWLRHTSPRSSAAWFHAGDLYLAAYYLKHEPQDLQAAVQAYERAVATYPNHAGRRARFALALAEAGDNRAAAEANAAWRLDRGTPHLDQKLPAELREAMIKHGWPEPPPLPKAK